MRLYTLRRWFVTKILRRPPPPIPTRVVEARPAPILPVKRNPDSLYAMASVPQAVADAEKNYLAQIGVTRTDSLLDGLISGPYQGYAGGGWKNFVTGHGTFARDKVMQGGFDEPLRITDPELTALYNGNDLAKRIVETIPREMFRRGWVLVVPQDEQDENPEEGAEGPDGSAAALEQPAGGESGPAAPGSPLVDPMGASPDNARAKVPTQEEGNPMSADVAPAAAQANVEDPMDASGGTSTDPTTGANPTGEPAKPVQTADPEQGPRDIDAKTDPKPAPGKDDKEADDLDQPDGADLAIEAEAYAARLSLKARFLEASIFGRLYGGGILIIGADDDQDMSLPLKEDSIETIRYLAWVDRRFVFANSWYAQIGPKYGEVESWQIVNPFGGQSNTVVHESRVIRFDGAPVDFLMRRRLLGWTLSVLQAPYDTLRQFDMSFQSIANLMSDLSQAYMKIQGLMQLISTDPVTLQTRMQMTDMMRSSARMLLLDAENEEFGRAPTPLSGVSDIMQMQMLRTAAAAEQPVALLFGREPSGLNATGDADFRRFYDVTAGRQKTDLEPKLRRAYTLIFAAKDGPTSGQVSPKGVEFVWHKLYEPSEKEQSEIRLNMAQADDYYINNQTLLPEEVALSRFRTGDLHLDTEIKTDLRDQSLETAQLAPSGKAKADAEAQQAKDMATHQAAVKGAADIATKGAPQGKDPNKGPPKPAGKPPAR